MRTMTETPHRNWVADVVDAGPEAQIMSDIIDRDQPSNEFAAVQRRHLV
jgi:hypothetical protein